MVTEDPNNPFWFPQPGGTGAATWGLITGTITDQADLIAYLNTNYQPAGTYLVPADIGVTVQGYSANLASWAAVTRAAGFDAFVSTPTSANLAALVTDETGSGALVFGTSPTFTTDITTPLIIGGTAVGSGIQYKGTTANGTATAAAHSFLVGNNGASTAQVIYNNGTVQIGTSTSKMFYRGAVNGHSYNRNPDTGAMTNSNAFGYQWNRVESTTDTADTLGLTVYNTAGTSVRAAFFVNGKGHVGFGTSTPTAYIHLSAGTATASTAPLKFTSGTNLTTPEAGAMEYDGKTIYFTPVTNRRSLILASDIATADTTVANTVTETTIYTGNIDANALNVGKVITLRNLGIYSTANGADTFTLRVKIGGTTVITIVSTAGNVTNTPFDIEFIGTVRTIGAGGTIQCFVKAEVDAVNKTTANSSTSAIDTTTSNTVTVTIEWSAADAGNTLTSQQGFFRLIN